jgi:hypothetical protein
MDDYFQKHLLMKVNKTKCATCPWRENSPYAYLRSDLTASALSNKSRICHSTGRNNAIHKRTGKPETICRGARDEQLQMFHRIGFLAEATDAAWEKKCKEMKLKC